MARITRSVPSQQLICALPQMIAEHGITPNLQQIRIVLRAQRTRAQWSRASAMGQQPGYVEPDDRCIRHVSDPAAVGNCSVTHDIIPERTAFCRTGKPPCSVGVRRRPSYPSARSPIVTPARARSVGRERDSGAGRSAAIRARSPTSPYARACWRGRRRFQNVRCRAAARVSGFLQFRLMADNYPLHQPARHEYCAPAAQSDY